MRPLLGIPVVGVRVVEGADKLSDYAPKSPVQDWAKMIAAGGFVQVACEEFGANCHPKALIVGVLRHPKIELTREDCPGRQALGLG